MTFEWILFCGSLLAAAILCARKTRVPALRWCALTLVGAAAAGAAFWQSHLKHQTVSRDELLAKTPKQAPHDGYISSDSCRSCHPTQYDSWRRSFHRTMTQHATPETVRANFSNVSLRLENETYTFQRDGEEFWVEMTDPDWKYAQTMRRTYGDAAVPAALRDPTPPRVRKRVGMLTGSHHMQAFWVWSRNGNLQFSLPFTYIFEAEKWAPRNDVFLWKPDAPHVQQIWNMTCINCHSTAGQCRDNRLSRQFETRAAELGIACEACHGPAQEHIERYSNPIHRYAAHWRKDDQPNIVNPAHLDHVKSSETCSRCHAIRYNPNPQDWNLEGVRFQPGGEIEANAPLAHYEHYDANSSESPAVQKRRAMMQASFWSDGLVRVSGREFSGLSESGCYKRGQIACTSCHSMHKYMDNDDQLGSNMDGNAACLQCHGSFAAKVERHTHHSANSSGSLCYNCHMPFTSYGLLKAIRSHTINSPSVSASVQTGRPNACNLCHLDRSLDWTQRQLSDWFGAPKVALTPEQTNTSAAVLWLLKGDAGQRVLIAWHMGWDAAKSISSQDWLPLYLAETLTDTYSVVRYVGQRSLKRLPDFRDFSYDYIGPAAERLAAQERALNIWRKSHLAPAARNHTVLVGTDGSVEQETYAKIRHERDDHPMELFE